MEQLAQRVKEEPEIESESKEDLTSSKVTVESLEHKEKPIEMAEYIKDLWQIGEAENHFEMKNLLKEIDDFVLSEIKRNEMKESRESYEEIIKKYENRIKLPENVDIYTKTEKIVELIRIDAKLLKALKEKEELLAGDPTKMTSTQLKQYIQGKR